MFLKPCRTSGLGGVAQQVKVLTASKSTHVTEGVQTSQKIVPGVYAVDMHEIIAPEDGENYLHNMFSEMS